jgi:hypothetical protein
MTWGWLSIATTCLKIILRKFCYYNSIMARHKIENPIPSWAAKVYIAFSLILLPWSIYLGTSLPRYHLSAHWDVSWTGLDVGIIVALVLTGLFAYLKSHWIIISASSVGSLLLVDAWFDVMSERRGLQLHEAVLLAVFIEIPLAITSYRIAYIALKDQH